MAHEISILENGIVEAMYANNPAWHGLGAVVDHAPSSEEAIKLAHLDWKVEAEPLYLGDGSKVEGYFGTVRKDTGKVLGVVSNRYQVWQNHEAFNFLDSFVQDGIMKYESAMALREGKRIVLLARMPSIDEVAEGDKVLRYLHCSTSHDGSLAINIQPTSVRVVCANTQRLALADRSHTITIKHTENLGERLDYARKYLSQFDEAFTLYRDHAKVLATKKLKEGDAKEFIAKLFPEPSASSSDRVKNNYLKKLEELRNCFQIENKLIPSAKGSYWTLYNAVTRFVDHCSKNKGQDDRSRLENKFFSVMEGQGADLKEKAFELALAMSA